MQLSAMEGSCGKLNLGRFFKDIGVSISCENDWVCYLLDNIVVILV